MKQKEPTTPLRIAPATTAAPGLTKKAPAGEGKRDSGGRRKLGQPVQVRVNVAVVV